MFIKINYLLLYLFYNSPYGFSLFHDLYRNASHIALMDDVLETRLNPHIFYELYASMHLVFITSMNSIPFVCANLNTLPFGHFKHDFFLSFANLILDWNYPVDVKTTHMCMEHAVWIYIRTYFEKCHFNWHPLHCFQFN